MSLPEISDLRLCKKYAKVFALFYTYGVDPFDSILKLLDSEVQYDYDNKTIIAASQSELYDLERLEESTELHKFSYEYDATDILWFMGYVLLYLSYSKSIMLKEFVTRECLQYLWDNYEVLHTQSTEYVVDVLLERFG